jgi:hypothetical protein
VQRDIKERQKPEHSPQAQQMRQARQMAHGGDHQGDENEIERRLAALELEELDRIDPGAEAEPAEEATGEPGERHQARRKNDRLVDQPVTPVDIEHVSSSGADPCRDTGRRPLRHTH